MKMFWKKTRNRKVFGFQCDQNLAQGARLMARAMGFPIYVVVEHALQIGLAEITTLLNNEKAREDLENHLQIDHLLPRNINKPATNYDEQFLAAKKQDVIRNLIEEKKEDVDVEDSSRYLFALAKIFGIKPLFLIGFLQELLLRDRYPKDWSTPYNPNRSVNYSAKREEENEEEELPDEDDSEEE